MNPSNNDRVRYYLDNTWRQGSVSGNLMATIESGALSENEGPAESIVSISMNYLAEW